ncbi:hypothetical protein F2P56_030760 [Juglans regia]|uniref:Uncharacterized protein LOC108994002 n=2 Tax=Juglans regia TaxID=51240 RepID=A0A2I4EYZ3_JUGRE|nr:uncharacterized protein LOC108994002 [Juglans regia]KAF5450402.1 hypothetical protein F2P56_030760 [Juglans regia]
MCMSKSGWREDAFGMEARVEVLYEGKQPITVVHGENGPSLPFEPIIIEELNVEGDEDLAHDGCALAQYGSDPDCADVAREKTCIDGFICSDSDSDGVLEHLSKENLVVLDSDTQLGKKCQGKGIKLRGGKLWMFWAKDLNLVVECMGDQFLTIRISNLHDLWITFVYAKCSYLERRRLWDSLMGANFHQLPWMVMGDFNIIRNDSERRGGRPRLALAMEEFNGWVGTCGLLDMPFRGNSLSWCNGHSGSSRHWARLDRCFFNTAALDTFPDATMEYLARTSSDHAPMTVLLENQFVRYGYPSFKFQQMWVSHAQFFNCVLHSWNSDVIGGSWLYMLVTKLKRLRTVLRIWNKQVFGRTDSHIEALEDRIKGLEANLQSEFNEDVEDDLVASQLELSVWMDREEKRLAQQAKQGWIQKGEASSNFFRAISRRNHKEVKEMKLEDGSILSSPEQIHEGAISYFSQFLEAGIARVEPCLGELVQPIISQCDNDFISHVPSSREVYDALCSILKDSSPGPDGFGSGFYRSCWHIVGTDVVDAVAEFFRVVMNGVPKGFFKGGRGLRQDDVVIFCNGGKASLKAITDVLKTYELWSGQAVSVSRRRALLRFTSFTEGSFPFKYLGVPIISGGLKITHFDDLIAKVQSRLEGWQTRLLSSGARLILIKHVLQSIPVHSLSILKTPKAVIEKLQRIISTFFWGFKDGKAKKKWRSWVALCKPVTEGGLGICSLQDVQSSLHMKIAWNLLQGTSLWSQFFLAKYIGDRHISMVDPKKGSIFWKMILKNIPLVQANSKWKVREGKLFFWHDNWDDDGPLCANTTISDKPNLKLEDCKTGLGWNMEFFSQLVGHHKAEELILKLGRVKSGKDMLIWLPNADGHFSTKSA